MNMFEVLFYVFVGFGVGFGLSEHLTKNIYKELFQINNRLMKILNDVICEKESE